MFQITAAVLTLVGTMVIILMPVITVVFSVFIRLISPRFRVVQQKLGGPNSVLQENFAGAEVVRAFAAEAGQVGRYRTRNGDLYQTNLEVIRLISMGFSLTFFLGNLATIIVLWYGGSLVIDGTVSLGLLVAFTSYLGFLLQPIVQLGFAGQQAARSSAPGARIFEIPDTPPEIKVAADAPDCRH